MIDLKNPDRVRVVAEALHYVRRYHGKTVVIKYGGNAMIDENLKAAFARDVTLLKLVGINPVIVHGGGPQINETLAQIGVPTRFVEGLRYTDKATMNVVEMVLGGLVNQEIVGMINQAGGRAVGLTGKDGELIRARQLKIRRKNGGNADIGLVGEVAHINPKILSLLEHADFIPVIAPVAVDASGQTLNINADTAAAELAVALQAEALFLLTNTAGVLDKKGKLLTRLTVRQAREKIKSGVISGGMKPKVECAIRAVQGGVCSCQIISGTTLHALLLEIFTDEGAGTFIASSFGADT